MTIYLHRYRFVCMNLCALKFQMLQKLYNATHLKQQQPSTITKYNKRQQTNCTNERNPLRETIFILFYLYYLGCECEGRDRERLGVCTLLDYCIVVILMRNRFFCQCYPLSTVAIPLSIYLVSACVCVWYNITFFFAVLPN